MDTLTAFTAYASSRSQHARDQRGDDDDEEPEYVISTGDTGWYDYSETDHTLAPRKHVYVIRSVTGAHFKLAVLNYYNAAGSSGYMHLKWQRLDGKPLPTVDAGPGPSAPDASMPEQQDAGPPSASCETYAIDASGNTLLNSWYDYNPATHISTPKNQAYFVRTARGGYAKLRITIDLAALTAQGTFGRAS